MFTLKPQGYPRICADTMLLLHQSEIVAEFQSVYIKMDGSPARFIPQILRRGFQ